MLEQTIALVYALLTHLSPGMAKAADRTAVVGLARAAEDPEFKMTREELADEVVYGALESRFKDHPRAWSWDARGGVSCGYLQEPCWYVKDHDDEAQARWWMGNERAAGLASVDSDPKRAARRAKIARRLLAEIESCPWHGALLAAVFPEKRDVPAAHAEMGFLGGYPSRRLARLTFFVNLSNE